MHIIEVTIYILTTASQEYIGHYDSLKEANRAANENNGGYIPHSQEIYWNSADENDNIIPLYQNFSGHDIEPSYFVHPVRKTVHIVHDPA